MEFALFFRQYPSDFSPEISSAMATKILHGNGTSFERVKAIVQLIGAEGREAEISTLGRFQAFFSNRHFTRTYINTMNYPLYLLWSYLRIHEVASFEELENIDGLDTSKLPMRNLIRQLELLGLVEERDSEVIYIKRDI